MTNTEKNWSDYWRSEGISGEVFVNKDGEKHPVLTTYWQDQFADLPAQAKILDLACGAGSIYAHLAEEHGYVLHAADISAEALDLLQKRMPGTETTLCPAQNTPFEDAMFNMVVSQFGLEYAGLEAFSEAARLVSPNGKLVALCHYQDGYIDANNRAQLAGANIVQEIDFIKKASVLTQTTFRKRRKDEYQEAREAFIPAERTLAEAVKKYPNGVHTYLYIGFRQMYERRRAYDLRDITGWLKEMKEDVEKNILRLSEMCNAALNESQLQEIAELLQTKGFQDIDYSVFKMPDKDLPVAWQLTATRS
ncbi:MAG: class I SAM-dependent methyltransferase [Pseudomonadota bacterium]